MEPVKIITAAGPGLKAHWNPLRTFAALWGHRSLIHELTRRDFTQRYRGSYLGLVWTLVTPLLFLAIYTFVFSVVLRARWPGAAGQGHVNFALAVFCGLVLYGVFSESAIVAPTLVLANPNYVTKTVFPLEVLPVVAVASAVLRAAGGLVMLLLGIVAFTGHLSWTVVLMVLPLAAAVLLSLGVGWFLAALGVFVRDAAHTVAVVVQLLFFLTPIVYPVDFLDRAPVALRGLIYANPFTHLVRAGRAVMLWGEMPDWPWLLAGLLISLVVFQLGYMFFTKSSRTFADVM